MFRVIGNLKEAITLHKERYDLEVSPENRGNEEHIGKLSRTRFHGTAEALLIYAEAKAELNQLIQADVDLTINKLRARVGMPNLILGSITPDPNWPDYGYSLPDYLYEIRRERVVELFGEGFRFDDLMRWRAHSIFIGKRPSGVAYSDIKSKYPNVVVNSQGFVDPFKTYLRTGAYGFNPGKDYLKPLPLDELTLNKNLKQNPGW